jgi:hypothetical protein
LWYNSLDKLEKGQGRMDNPEFYKDRLLSQTVRQPDGCWTFQGARNNRGYGMLSVNGIVKGAHVVSFEIHRGPVNGKYVLHSCDERSCVNPDHLWLGTQSENVEDAIRKGTHACVLNKGYGTRSCNECEREYPVAKPWQKFCSLRCRNAWHRRLRQQSADAALVSGFVRRF